MEEGKDVGQGSHPAEDPGRNLAEA